MGCVECGGPAAVGFSGSVMPGSLTSTVSCSPRQS